MFTGVRVYVCTCVRVCGGRRLLPGVIPDCLLPYTCLGPRITDWLVSLGCLLRGIHASTFWYWDFQQDAMATQHLHGYRGFELQSLHLQGRALSAKPTTSPLVQFCFLTSMGYPAISKGCLEASSSSQHDCELVWWTQKRWDPVGGLLVTGDMPS